MQQPATTPPVMNEALLGLTIAGSHRIDAPLRAGNMGAVYLSTQLSVGRQVALKVVERKKISEERALERFLQEAQLISRLEHPNIVRLYDFGEDKEQGVLFLAMEFINGPTLSDILSTSRLNQNLMLDLGAQICRALIESHAQGVVHRDLKPANILLSRMSDGSLQLKVVDFGVARALEINKQLTTDGAICGTPRYMAPEQAKQQGKVDGRADLYNLGLILYEMACGYPPFDAEGAIELIIKHINEPHHPLEEFLDASELDPEFAQLIHSLLAKSPKDRPQGALDVLEKIDLLRVKHSVPPSIRLGLKAPIDQELQPHLHDLSSKAGHALVWQPDVEASAIMESEPQKEPMQFVSLDSSQIEQVLPPSEASEPKVIINDDVLEPDLSSQEDTSVAATSLPSEEEDAPQKGASSDLLASSSPSLVSESSEALSSDAGLLPEDSQQKLKSLSLEEISSSRPSTMKLHAVSVPTASVTEEPEPSEDPIEETSAPPLMPATIDPQKPFTSRRNNTEFSHTVRELFLRDGAKGGLAAGAGAQPEETKQERVFENTEEELFMAQSESADYADQSHEHFYIDDGRPVPKVGNSNRALLLVMIVVTLGVGLGLTYILLGKSDEPAAKSDEVTMDTTDTSPSNEQAKTPQKGEAAAFVTPTKESPDTTAPKEQVIPVVDKKDPPKTSPPKTKPASAKAEPLKTKKTPQAKPKKPKVTSAKPAPKKTTTPRVKKRPKKPVKKVNPRLQEELKWLKNK